MCVDSTDDCLASRSRKHAFFDITYCYKRIQLQLSQGRTLIISVLKLLYSSKDVRYDQEIGYIISVENTEHMVKLLNAKQLF